jgi:hypothetical protein
MEKWHWDTFSLPSFIPPITPYSLRHPIITLYRLDIFYLNHKIERLKIKTQADVPVVVPFYPSNANYVLLH